MGNMNEELEKKKALSAMLEAEEETPAGVPFYRCKLCGTVVSPWDIYEKHTGCTVCSCRQIVPTNLTFTEKIIQIVKHPKIWEWKKYVK